MCEPSSPSECQAWPVFLWDRSQERGARVKMALIDLNHVLLHVLSAQVTISPGCVALVGLASAQPSPSEIAVIRELRASDATIMCYAPRTDASPLCDRCQLLLAGARDLMDCEARDFEIQVRFMIGSLCKRALLQNAEKTRLLEHMRQVGVVGESERMLSIFRLVERVGRFSELPVLITGETGVGKELIANAIHRQDPHRRDRVFVPVNCGALNSELAGSELFGHTRGAFTGAGRDRPGLFRAAHKGVLFLDEVGELSLPLQAKLLRVLQSGRVLVLGEDRETTVDVRLIAATNRDLRKMAGDGSFREDLFHRLNVTAIHIPPLRERRNDIVPLVAYFVERYCQLVGAETIEAAPDFLRGLESARLPGNARQVENLVRHAVARCELPGRITLRDLPDDLLQELTEDDSCPRMPGQHDDVSNGLTAYLETNHWNLSRSLRHIENIIVQAALNAANGNQVQAARRLGITPRSVYNKLHRR